MDEVAFAGELRERRVGAFDAAFDCATEDELGVGSAVVGAGTLIFLGATTEFALLLRPCKVLSGIANATILKVAHHSLRVLLQHRHVLVGRFA